ncbi:MAG: response regulator [Proteobacteria bacterium]|nr:response regulator [Pseudomonadota bacterium]
MSISPKTLGSLLLVDDEAMILNSMSRLLSRLGYEVFTANDEQTAVDLYKQNKNRIELVILDLVMPGKDGAELFNDFKRINPRVKVLLCSGRIQSDEVDELLAKGACGFLSKPFNIKQLTKEVTSALT